MEFDRAWIDARYEDHFRSDPDKRLGWSFMYVPEDRVLTAPIMLVGLNPAGRDNPDEGHWDYREGVNAYADQPWGKDGDLNALQREIDALFKLLGMTAADVFAAQLVPFRSPRWTDLPRREQAIQTFEPLWRSVLARSPARLVLTLGKRTGRQLAHWTQATAEVPSPIGWGHQTIETFVTDEGKLIVALPHPSRFGVFHRSPRDAALDIVRAAGNRACS